jgi:trehalose/maltose hydrolase-like predicted phosphorylase
VARGGGAGGLRRAGHTTGLAPRTRSRWQRAADAMYIPYDEERGIHPQDANFLEKERWDFENTPTTSTRCCSTTTRS